MLDKVGWGFINAIGDVPTRRRVYQHASEIVTDNEKCLELLRTQVTEMIRATKEIRKQRLEDEAKLQRLRKEKRSI